MSICRSGPSPELMNLCGTSGGTLRGYLLRVPAELAAAARLDGASWIAVLRRIVLPLVRDGLVATGVLVFVLDWTLYLLPTLLVSLLPAALLVRVAQRALEGRVVVPQDESA